MGFLFLGVLQVAEIKHVQWGNSFKIIGVLSFYFAF